MPQSSHYSALSSWVLLLAKAFDSYGHDSRELFAQAGLDHSRLREPLARFPATAVMKMWAIGVETTGDPCFGLKVASFWHPTTLHALGYSWLASDNLAEAFDCAVRYTRIVNTAAQGILRVDSSPQHYKLIAEISRGKIDPVPAAVEASMAIFHIMCRSAYGPDFRMQRVAFRHKAPSCRKCFDELFQAPVEFDAGETALWIDPNMVREPLATANPELARINDQIVTDYLAQLDQGDLGMRVRSKLIEHLPGGHFSEAEIASMLNVSQRSLQRKLREQGQSFTQLVESTRSELAQQYVRDPQHSFNEVAFLLGFTEPANFSRAFKRWHGKSPTEFRQDSLS